MAEESLQNKEAEFYRIYNEKIKPQFNNLEKERIKIKNNIIKKLFLFVFLPYLLITPILIYSATNLSNIPILGNLIGFLLFFSLPAYIGLAFYGISTIVEGNKRFKNKLKQNFLQELLNIFGNIYWNKKDSKRFTESIFSDQDIQESGLFFYSYKRADDEFQGTYKNVSFKISEMKFFNGEEDPSTNANNNEGIFLYEKSTVDEGIILSFKFNKTIKNRTVVSSKDYSTINDTGYKYWLAYMTIGTIVLFLIFPLLDLIFKIASNIYAIVFILLIIIGISVYLSHISKKAAIEEPLNEVHLEDPKFSERFNVYSSDQVEARYLVTTAFMERFYNLKTAFGANKIKCSFFDDTLMIAIYTKKDLFELGSLFKSLNNPDSINDLFGEFNSIFKIIDYLKLYENIGL